MANGDIHYLDEAGLQLLWDKIKENFVAGGILQSDASKYTAAWKQNARKNIGMINVGSATQPIYLDANGNIKTITYTLGSACAKNTGTTEGTVPLLGVSGKLPLSTIPDVILGQVLYGGTVDDNALATLSTNVKTKLGISSDTVTLTNNDGTYGYKKFEGVYFIASADAPSSGFLHDLDIKVGDWLISTGEAWKKIDNTDAVTSVNGYTGAVTLYGTDIAVSSTDDTNINAALAGKQAKVAAEGSTTKPLYTSANGTFSECSTYAGGTAVTLNGTSKAANTASFYAPTSAGTSGQFLKSSGSGAPSWTSFGAPTMSWSGGTSSGPTLNTKDILGNQLTATIPLATASVSGVVTTDSQTFAGDKTFNGNIIGMQGVSAKGIVDLTIGSGGGGSGTVTGIIVGSGTVYTPGGEGYVTIPAYPTTLPASDVYSWAKAATKPTYTYDELSVKPTSAQIQALVGNYITTFGTKTGAITVRGGQDTTGAVNLTMSDNQLQASIYDSNSAAYKAAGTANGNVPILGAASTNKNNYPVLFDSNGNLIAGGGAIGSFAYISSLAFSSLTSKPTTIGGYGITDAKIVFGSDDVAQKKRTSTITLGTNTLTTALEITIDTNNVTTGFGLLHKDVLVTMSRISDLVIQNLS